MVHTATSPASIESEVFLHQLEELIRQRTAGGIRGLRIELADSSVILTGRSNTYYAKQLATQAVLDACENLTLDNAIEVE